jgi:hypothetical protein
MENLKNVAPAITTISYVHNYLRQQSSSISSGILLDKRIKNIPPLKRIPKTEIYLVMWQMSVRRIYTEDTERSSMDGGNFEASFFLPTVVLPFGQL